MAGSTSTSSRRSIPTSVYSQSSSDELRADFATELTLFLESILLEDRNVQEILTADHTFLNERLARHYGIASVRGPQFRRVTLADETRHGLLGKGAALLRTSYGDRTSPVLRGAWVLDKLMGTPPTPPPPNVETDLTTPAGERPKTIRARLEQHRADQICNACHGVIDPYGLALENFTVTGQWREFDDAAGEPIDAATVLPGGVAIKGPVELKTGTAAALGSVRAGAHTQALDVRDRPADRVSRHAAGAGNRARGGAG